MILAYIYMYSGIYSHIHNAYMLYIYAKVPIISIYNISIYSMYT